jgi:hypothetical protein
MKMMYKILQRCKYSQDSSVNIVIGYRLDDWIQFSEGTQILSGAHPVSCLITLLVTDAWNYLPPSSAQVKSVCGVIQ